MPIVVSAGEAPAPRVPTHAGLAVLATSQALVRCLRTAALVLSALWRLACCDLLARRRLAALHRLIQSRRVGAPHAWSCSTEEIVWAVEEACVWYVRRATCLPRSAATTWMLRREGLPAELIIGLRPLPIESHAWVEVHGAIVNDRPQYQKFFHVVTRL